MKPIMPFALLLAACSQQPAAPPIEAGVYAGEGRDRICIAGDAQGMRGGVIVFGSDSINCSSSGRIEDRDGKLALVPRGEGPCRIPFTSDGDTLRIAEVPQACSYYCGPGASFADKSFKRTEEATKVLDLAGDPLC